MDEIRPSQDAVYQDRLNESDTINVENSYQDRVYRILRNIDNALKKQYLDVYVSAGDDDRSKIDQLSIEALAGEKISDIFFKEFYPLEIRDFEPSRSYTIIDSFDTSLPLDKIYSISDDLVIGTNVYGELNTYTRDASGGSWLKQKLDIGNYSEFGITSLNSLAGIEKYFTLDNTQGWQAIVSFDLNNNFRQTKLVDTPMGVHNISIHEASGKIVTVDDDCQVVIYEKENGVFERSDSFSAVKGYKTQLEVDEKGLIYLLDSKYFDIGVWKKEGPHWNFISNQPGEGIGRFQLLSNGDIFCMDTDWRNTSLITTNDYGDRTTKKLWTSTSGYSDAIALSPKWSISSSRGRIEISSLEHLTEDYQILVHNDIGDSVRSFDVSPSGKIYVSYDDQTVAIFEGVS